MSRRWSIVWGLLAGLIPISTFPLGLGEINLRSGLNQPLDAEVELLAVNPEDLERATIQVAPDEAFKARGIDRPAFLSHLRFSTQRRADGAPYIKITSTQPIREPFVDFLIELSGTKGRLLRQYTLLLDPPNLAQAAVVASRRSEIGTPSRESLAYRDAGGAAASVAGSEAGQAGRYGPVSRNETLWSIAQRLRPDSSVSVHQMVMSLFRANPHAFIRQNMNYLREGEVLRVPAVAEVAAQPRQQAIQELQQQTRAARGPAVDKPAQQTAAQQTQGVQASGETMKLKVVGPTAEASVAAAAPGTPAAGADPQLAALHEELTLANEELNTKRQENQQLKARVEELEGMVSSMERLITLKTEELAQLQTKAIAPSEAKPEPSSHPSSAHASAPAPAKPTPAATSATGQAAANTPPSHRVQVLPPVTESASRELGVFGLLGNPLLLVGLAASLMLLVGLIWRIRRSRARSMATYVPASGPQPEPAALRSWDTVAKELAAGPARPVEASPPSQARAVVHGTMEPVGPATSATATAALAVGAAVREGIPSAAPDTEEVPLFDFGVELGLEESLSPGGADTQSVELEPRLSAEGQASLEQHSIDFEMESVASPQQDTARLASQPTPEPDLSLASLAVGVEGETARLEREPVVGDQTLGFMAPEDPSDTARQAVLDVRERTPDLGPASQEPSQEETARIQRRFGPRSADHTLEYTLDDTGLTDDTAHLSAQRPFGQDGLMWDGAPESLPEIAAESSELPWPSHVAGDTLTMDTERIPGPSSDLAAAATAQTPAITDVVAEDITSTLSVEDGVPTGLAAVQTKLDLAKVYIELGVIEDAGSLLQEVREQGDDTQRQEAQALLLKIA